MFIFKIQLNLSDQQIWKHRHYENDNKMTGHMGPKK